MNKASWSFSHIFRSLARYPFRRVESKKSKMLSHGKRSARRCFLERRLGARRLTPTRIIARAERIKAGAPLLYSAETLSRAMNVFFALDAMWFQYQGDARDYLRNRGVNKSFGMPTCVSCDRGFTTDQAYAKHRLSLECRVAPMRGAIRELRGHIHAFPIDAKDYETGDASKVLERYKFRDGSVAA